MKAIKKDYVMKGVILEVEEDLGPCVRVRLQATSGVYTVDVADTPFTEQTLRDNVGRTLTLQVKGSIADQ